MDRGESRRTGDRLLPGDTCARGAPPDALPVIRFESSDEEGISSEPEVCVSLAGVEQIQVDTRLHTITDVIQTITASLQGRSKARRSR